MCASSFLRLGWCLVMSRSSCLGMLIPCPPQAAHALHPGPPAGPPPASSWYGDTCEVPLTVCGGHATDVCRRERLRVLAGVNPGECSRLERGQEKEAVVHWS